MSDNPGLGAAAASDRGRTDASSLPARFLWTCPLCGKRRLTVYAGGELFRAANDLRTHIRARGDAEHGGPNAYPDPMEPFELESHVRRLEPVPRSRSGSGSEIRA